MTANEAVSFLQRQKEMQVQAQVVENAGLQGFGMLAFADQSPLLPQIAADQFRYVSATLSDVGQRLMQSARESYDSFMNSNSMRMAKAAVRMAKGIFHPNVIAPLTTLAEIQSAKGQMQRVVMANPTVRKLYNQQLCDGYDGSYVNPDPGTIRDEQYDYRRVMHGSMIEKIDKETGESYEVFRMYPDHIMEGDRALTIQERQDVLHTWDIIEMFASQGKDVTSPFDIDLSI
jgi:hypothetical protein